MGCSVISCDGPTSPHQPGCLPERYQPSRRNSHMFSPRIATRYPRKSGEAGAIRRAGGEPARGPTRARVRERTWIGSDWPEASEQPWLLASRSNVGGERAAEGGDRSPLGHRRLLFSAAPPASKRVPGSGAENARFLSDRGAAQGRRKVRDAGGWPKNRKRGVPVYGSD
ncbi:MAG: hypothetical protein ACI80K_003265 [Paracoccaceae bacterium]|jgi:hypothetical protein